MKNKIIAVVIASLVLVLISSSIIDAKKRKRKEKDPEPPPTPKIEVKIPPDVPIYPDGKIIDEGYDTIEKKTFFRLETSDDMDKFYEFYLSSIKKEGWRILAQEKGSMISAEKDPARFLETGFSKNEDKSIVKVKWF